MPKLTFDSAALKDGFGVARLVKPKTGDYVLQVRGNKLIVVSSDARKYARAEIKAIESDCAPDYVSDEFFLSEDRKSILEPNLERVRMSITDKGINVVAEEDGQSRKALIRKRPDNSRRPFVPRRLEASHGLEVWASVLEEILRHVSCSALIKETKTEDDMRVNQVHFYAGEECAVSNARSHATIVRYPGLNLDSSIVSSDIPLIRSFCAKVKDGVVKFGQDATHVFVMDPATGHCVFASRVSGKRPDFAFHGLEEEKFGVTVKIKGDEFHTNVAWAVTAVEGTSRITFSTEDNGKGGKDLVLSADSNPVANFPADSVDGGGLRADFHIGCISQISPYLAKGTAVLRYGHREHGSLLDISVSAPEPLEKTKATDAMIAAANIRARHFVRSMKEK